MPLLHGKLAILASLSLANIRSLVKARPLLHGKLAILASLSLANVRSLLKARPPGGQHKVVL